MKKSKMLVLVATAAMALLAFVGAGAASADELCTEKANAENMCPAGKLIEKLELSLVGSATKEDTEGTVLETCTSGTIRITEINPAHNNKTGTESVTGTVPKEDFTLGSIGTSCSLAETTLSGGTIHFTHAAGGGTTVTATEVSWTTNTVFFGSCVYGVGTGVDLGTIAQGGNTLVIKAAVKKLSGFVCPETTVWTATYKVTNHNAVFYITN